MIQLLFLRSLVTTALQADSKMSSPVAWSVLAGCYMLVVGVIVSSTLFSVLSVFAEVIDLPAANAGVVLASPALVFGAGAWWGIVERRNATSYRHGVVVGTVTALLVGLAWTTAFAAIWGFEMLTLPMTAFPVAVVLGMAILVGGRGLPGIPLMHARHQLQDRV